MKNTKLTRKELHQGYIQQYVIGDFRIELRRTLYNSGNYYYRIFTLKLRDDVIIDKDERVFLTMARQEFARQVSAAKKLMRKDK